MINPTKDIPGNIQGIICISGTAIVRRYRMITLTNQDKSPKVKRLMGINNIFNIGETRIIRMLNTNPAPVIICQPEGIFNVGRI
jgi:hypothetical protein